MKSAAKSNPVLPSISFRVSNVQTRLPGTLSALLQSIVADYESDMSLLRAENSDSETLSLDMPDTIQCPLIFPSGQLLEVLADAVKVSMLTMQLSLLS